MIRIFVTEFAENKKELERSLKPKTDIIMEHIEKLILMPNHSAINHWKKEIASQLYKVERLKGKNKYPTSKQLYDWTWGKVEDIVNISYAEVSIKNVEFEYGVVVNIDATTFLEKFRDVCDSYFSWLCTELSERWVVSFQEIYKKLDELV